MDATREVTTQISSAVCMALAGAIAWMPAPSVAQSADAAAPTADALDAYLESHIEYRPPGLFTQPSLLQGGREVEVGFFGGDAASVFGESPDAMEHMDSYRVKRIAGVTLAAVGIGTLIAEIVILLASPDTLIDPHSDSLLDGNGAYWGMLGGGLVLGVTGGVLVQSANGHMGDAIGAYNADLLTRIRTTTPRIQYSFTW